ncbi:MAG: alpha/beta fold hydrolase [Bacteroidales bacterium]|nr:alpha/beta fold hydrolase [Bacteroidales bacterium]
MKRFLSVIFFVLVCFASSAQIPAGVWSGKVEVRQGVSLGLVFRFSEEGGCTLDVPDQGARGIPAQATATLVGIKITVPSIGAAFEGVRLARGISGSFTQRGVSFPLTLSPGEPRLNRPQTPQGPFPYQTEEISFSNGDATLRGTLTLPEGCTRQTPVLLLVTGSGQQNRDEEIFEHKPFAVIADYLARRGIATLRYDDRGFGESTGDVLSATTEDFKEDARAGIDLLRERFARVGVLGHSEGGTIALMLAAEGKIDFVVSLAGMVVSGARTLLAQNHAALLQAGFPESETIRYCDALEKAFAQISAGEQPAASIDDYDLPEALRQNYKLAITQFLTPYMRYFITLDATKLLGQVRCPVLALNGTKDTQVDAATNLGALEEGLPAARIIRCEGLNHLFQHCRTGLATEYREIEETIAPEVLEWIAGWI